MIGSSVHHFHHVQKFRRLKADNAGNDGRVERIDMPDAISNMALQRQIDALGVRIDKGFDEIKAILSSNGERLRTLETTEAGCQPLITSRMDAAWREIDSHGNDIRELMDTVQALKQTNKLLSWIGGIAGSAFIVWLITQLLGLIAK